MATKRIPIDQEVDGSVGEYEDWWVLLIDEETAEKSVEHNWAHTDVHSGKSDNGTKRMSVEDFLQSDIYLGVKEKLKALL